MWEVRDLSNGFRVLFRTKSYVLARKWVSLHLPEPGCAYETRWVG